MEEADNLVAENHMLNEEMFWELRRVMKANGTICIVTDNSRYANFLAEQVQHMKTGDEWAFHSVPAADSRFMQTHAVVGA